MPIEKQNIGQFGSLELLARQVVEGFITGLHKSPFHGFSVEFAEHRLYNTGESVRHVDWKLFARTEKLFVKRYEEETNLRCRIILDASSSMYYKASQQEHSKMHFAIHAAASLVELLRKQRDAIGLSVFTDRVLDHLPAKSSRSHLNLTYSILENYLDNPTQNVGTAAVDALHEIAEKTHRRSLVILFSDMFDGSSSEEEIFLALQHLRHNKHEVILFHVIDKATEVDLDLGNRPYTMVDSETGEKLRLNPHQIKEAYKTQMDDYINRLKMKCGQARIDFVECDVREGYHPVLLKYLIKRGKMLS